MKKKLLISVLVIYILLTPINIYAQDIINSNEESNKVKVDNTTTITYDKYDSTSEFVSEYFPAEQQVLSNTPVTGCNVAYIINPTTGKVFYEKNAHEKMYPASTTKILTALVVIENCQLTDTAVVSQNAIDLIPAEGYSNAGLQVGEELRIIDLLYALLIPSANEVANVLAEHVSGSISAFSELCNSRAKELGCENLHFVNPSGIHDDDHYCTAYDLYLIAKECQKHNIFNEIVKTKSFTVPATEVYPYDDRTYENTNLLIQPDSSDYYYSYCTGIKTGHTTPAGDCLIASSSHDNIDLISVVLGGDINDLDLSERFYDTIQLFNFVYNNYSYKKIVNKGCIIGNINIENATKKTASLDLIVDSNLETIVPNDTSSSQIPAIIKIYDGITAPIEKFQPLGEVTLKIDGLNYTTKVLASHDVHKIPYWLINSIIAVVSLICLVILIIIIIKIVKKHKNSEIEILEPDTIDDIPDEENKDK